MNLQAHLPAALSAIHNFIRDLNPTDLNDFKDAEDVQPGWHSDLADGLPQRAERQRVNDRCDNIASEMWEQYQQYLGAGGRMDLD